MKNLIFTAYLILGGLPSAHAANTLDPDSLFPSHICSVLAGEDLEGTKMTFVHPGATRLSFVEIALPIGPNATEVVQLYSQKYSHVNKANVLITVYEKLGQAIGEDGSDYGHAFSDHFHTQTEIEAQHPHRIVFNNLSSPLDCPE